MTAYNSPKNRNRRIRRSRRSINFWFMEDDLRYNKICIRDVERIWLQTFQPEAKITRVRIPECETMARFKDGSWDGYANRVTFASKQKAMEFRLVWWSQKII